ncbi:AEC family transporter [Desulfosediminicola flagellatus]|uniref:AEC family transporter n=1 Tax=Desulfosediminicola flagellatus TaxID=2569541 RepID=UPI001C3D7809|nr:AEC family transporter [Desulfosediminicola flagellatus]
MLSLFFVLLGKILPLYISILLGFLSVRFLKVDKGVIAALLFYIIGPVVVFSATLSVEITPGVLFLPIFFYLFSSAIAFITLYIWGKQWPDATGNILAFATGTGNTGYFGIVLALILFEPQVADIFIFAMLASLFYETTTGYYVTAKGSFTGAESLQKVLRLPALYAFILALVLNVADVKLPEVLQSYTGQFKVVFSILGMMLLGMGFDQWKKSKGIDLKFLSISLIAKFIFWPLAILSLILLDKSITQLLNDDLYRVMFLFAIVPLAGNTVTLAVLLKAQPEKAAFAVLLSTVISIFSIPLMLSLYELI